MKPLLFDDSSNYLNVFLHCLELDMGTDITVALQPADVCGLALCYFTSDTRLLVHLQKQKLVSVLISMWF